MYMITKVIAKYLQHFIENEESYLLPPLSQNKYHSNQDYIRFIQKSKSFLSLLKVYITLLSQRVKPS